MNILEKFSKKNLASERLWRQIIGALFIWRPKFLWAFVILVIPLSGGITFILTSIFLNLQGSFLLSQNS